MGVVDFILYIYASEGEGGGHIAIQYYIASMHAQREIYTYDSKEASKLDSTIIIIVISAIKSKSSDNVMIVRVCATMQGLKDVFFDP